MLPLASATPVLKPVLNTPVLYTPLPDLEERWAVVMGMLSRVLGEAPPTTEAILLLIGTQYRQELPQGLSRQEKQDFIQLGSYIVLAFAGHYRKSFQDEEGWPHFELAQPLPYLESFSQAVFLKEKILLYLEHILLS